MGNGRGETWWATDVERILEKMRQWLYVAGNDNGNLARIEPIRAMDIDSPPGTTFVEDI